MDKKEAVIIARKYAKGIKPIIDYKNAYIFGSYSNDTQREHSDIDIGIFAEDISDDDYFDMLTSLYRAGRNVDFRIEPHLFIAGKDPSGFGEEIQRVWILL
jgi:predicted nucleotidyltransferase